MSIQIVCPLCSPYAKYDETKHEYVLVEEEYKETDTFDTNNIYMEKIVFNTWQDYANHILKIHPTDIRAIWATKNLEIEKAYQSKQDEIKQQAIKDSAPIQSKPKTAEEQISELRQMLIDRDKPKIIEKPKKKPMSTKTIIAYILIITLVVIAVIVYFGMKMR